jgi:hypothetical protein
VLLKPVPALRRDHRSVNNMVPSEMDRTTHVPTACTSASSASPWFIWAWLSDSTGTTGSTGTASPVAWQGNDITISFSRRESEPLTPPLPLSTNDDNSEPVSLATVALSSSTASSASGSRSALHSFDSNFLVLDTEQDQQRQQPWCRTRTPSSITSDTNPTNYNLNTTHTGVISSPTPTSGSFFLCSPSTSSFDAVIEDRSFPRARKRPRFRRSKMPGSTLPAPEQPCFSNQTYSVANKTTNTSQWRPHTSRSGRSARSASPLFARWARRHHQQPDGHESNDSRSSMDRKSTSSNGNSRGALQHQHQVCHNDDDASHKHDYNFSTSTVSRSGSSSKRHSQPGLPPPLTREEFEALPLAIQRKVRAFPVRLSHLHICNHLSPRNALLSHWPNAAVELGCTKGRSAVLHPMEIAVPCIS